MDMGFVLGQKIEIEEKRLGLWIVNMISENGNQEQTLNIYQKKIC